MKRLIRHSVTASSKPMKSNFKFTATDVLQLLMTIEELKGTPIELTQAESGDVIFTIGNNTYQFVGSNDTITM